MTRPSASPTPERRTTIQLTPESQAAVNLCRTEKAKRDERLASQPAMQQARSAYEALLERERQAGRGGRPKGSRNQRAGEVVRYRPPMPNVETDPLDALLNALRPWHPEAACG